MKNLDPIVNEQVDALLTDEHNNVANLANASALLYDAFGDINWCGFYLLNNTTGELDLGPFQGKVACMHIKPGSGVVGNCYQKETSIRVANVHEFPGHIACDSASNAELVTPLRVNGKIIGVLDIDSPGLDRFSTADEETVNEFAARLGKHLDAATVNALS